MNIEPDFKNIDDVDLIGLISYCEKWKPAKVYYIAYSQVFPKKQLKEVRKNFDEWAINDQKLPPIVREELIRACWINLKLGKMNRLKYTYMASKYTIGNKLFWIFILFILWLWL